MRRPDHPVLVKNTTLLEYLDPVQDTVSKTFSTDEDLVSVFTGSQRIDSAFDGLAGERYRYEELYPKPYVEPYFMAHCGGDEEDFGFLYCWRIVDGTGARGQKKRRFSKN